MREAVNAEQPASDRLRIHRRIAETLEALAGEHPADELGELARHFGAAGDVEKAARYAERAGERSMALLAFEVAAAHFEHALRLLEERAVPDASRRCDLLLAIGRARLAEGDRGRSRDAFRRAAAPASELGDGNRLVQSAIGFVTNTTTNTQDPEGAALLERALVALGPEDSSTRIRAMIRLAVVRLGLGAPEQAEALVREAAARAERLRDPRALGWVALNGVWLLTFLGKESPETLVASLDRAIALGRDVGQPELVNGAQELLLQPLLTLGDRRRADAVAASLAERAPWGGIRASMSVLYRCHAALQAGRLAEAERLVAEALAGPAKDYAPAWAESHLYLLRAEQGRLGEIELILEQRAASRPQIVELGAVRAHLLAELGRHGEARVELERAARDGFRDLPNVPLQNLGPVLLADACAALGAEEHAAPLYERLKPCAPYNAMAGAFGAFWGPVARPLGVLATLLARFDEAERYFADAAAFCRRMDAVLWGASHGARSHAHAPGARRTRRPRARAGVGRRGARSGTQARSRRPRAPPRRARGRARGRDPDPGPQRTRVSR